MAGARADYDRASGRLTIDVDRLTGSGTHATWTILAVSGTDYAEASHTHSPSATGLAPLGAEALAVQADVRANAGELTEARRILLHG